MKFVKILSAFLVGLFCVDGHACSVLGKMGPQSHFVGKNFDWFSGKGYLVQNDRQVKRSSFFKNGPGWKSKYSSVSFTTVGPGFPVSSMNEKGLVVEALVDNGFTGKIEKGVGLTALEWGQYVVDNFSKTKDVIDFADKQVFDQVMIPLHLFVCDRPGECAVIEKRAGKLQVTAGKDLKVNVLANQSWQEDYEADKDDPLGELDFPGKQHVPFRTSGTRFGKLAEASLSSQKASFDWMFKTLDLSKVPYRTKWQIVWNQMKPSLKWKIYKGKKAESLQSMDDLAGFFRDCKPGEVSVMDLEPKGKSAFRGYGKDDVKLTAKRLNLMFRLRFRSNRPDFARKIADHTKSSTCAHE